MAEQAFPPAPALADERVDLGQQLLQATDDLGLSAEGAAWVYDWYLKEWRYYLVTSTIDIKGSAWVYKRLLTAFKQLPQQDEFLALDVHLGSPNEIMFRLLSMYFRANEGPNFIELSRIAGKIDGVSYSFDANVVLYRMLEARSRHSIDRSTKIFDRNVRDLVTA